MRGIPACSSIGPLQVRTHTRRHRTCALTLTHTAITTPAPGTAPFSQERPAAPQSELRSPRAQHRRRPSPHAGELSGPCRYDAVGRHERKTDSFMPFMPMKDGWFQTHSTYRFITVREQVMTAIGEAKHGLWRIHDNGIIRLYRKGGKTGVPLDADVNDPTLLDTILSDYVWSAAPLPPPSNPTRLPACAQAAFIPKEETPAGDGWSGWRYANNTEEDGNAGFVDLPLQHPAFEGKYAEHVPIDLPHWFCTMSGAEFVDAADAWQFATSQPNANKVGPLGKVTRVPCSSELLTSYAPRALPHTARLPWLRSVPASTSPSTTPRSSRWTSWETPRSGSMWARMTSARASLTSLTSPPPSP